MLVVQFILLDMLEFHHAVVFFVAGFVAALIGSKAWAVVIRRWNKKSIIVFVLASYVSVATIAMAILSVYEIEFSAATIHTGDMC